MRTQHVTAQKIGVVVDKSKLRSMAVSGQQQKNMDSIAASFCCLMTSNVYVHASLLEKPETMFGWKPWMVQIDKSSWAKALLPSNKRTVAVAISGERALVNKLGATWEQWQYFLAGTLMKHQDLKDRIKSWIEKYPMTLDQFKKADLRPVAEKIQETWEQRPKSAVAEMANLLSSNPRFRITLN